jgi:hypothetical protein
LLRRRASVFATLADGKDWRPLRKQDSVRAGPLRKQVNPMSSIKGAAHASAATVEDVGVDLMCSYT